MRIGSLSILLGAILIGACDSSAPPVAVAHFQPIVDTKQLMTWVIEPNADVIWGAVGTIITEQGSEELAPKSDAEWNALRNAAVTIAESGNLLMMDGHARDRNDWPAKSQNMIAIAKTVMQAIEAKDVDALFTAGGELYESCVACHRVYSLKQPATQSPQ